MKPWEKNVIFDSDPTNEFIRLASYVNLEGKLLSEKELQIKPDSAGKSFSASLIKGQVPSTDNLVFLNSNSFKAGQIHTRVDQWKHIMCNSSQTKEVLDWIENGVNIHKYITSFKGKFLGEKYDHEFPPPRMFNNSNECVPFIDFITKTITERLRNGSLKCVGKVGLVQPPHIVAPLTVEPTKPRLCVNLMYLNNWIKSVPFNLDTLKDIPRIVKTGAYFTSIDDKSGFDNVRLSEESFNLVGFQWGGYYRCKTLPFGFKLSSYIYHTLNMQPTSYIRKHFSIPIFLYIDDRLVEEVRSEGIEPGIPSALLANYIVCEILNRLGYCLNLTKTIFVPTQSPVFLGFKVDSIERCFRLTESKKKKFVGFREACLAKSELSVLDLQKLSGRCISFMLTVPAAKLYTREMNSAISLGIKSKSGITLNGDLKDEITSWRFLDEWEGKLEWKRERHLSVTIFTDASTFKWGGVFEINDIKHTVGDSWVAEMLSLPIMIQEAYALLNVLKSFRDKIQGFRIDANVDNKALIYAWDNEGSRSSQLNSVIKDIFKFTIDSDIVLNLYYIPSKQNLADAPSRTLTKCDATITKAIWQTI
ncbi:unnamed protein product [Mytilus coruscus]|uniref:Reverse transcriptase domain-containing protein n=1 Tax=Mytilus coruscus TaxID=42192 RepID=A0A6J8DTX4_MYTCO|nr:unnamed protein product [Mytilus coruscus]